MSKTKKAAPKQGTEHNPIPWADPFPVSVLKGVSVGKDKNGKPVMGMKETVNGNKLAAGVEVTLGSDFAHAHAAALTAPKSE